MKYKLLKRFKDGGADAPELYTITLIGPKGEPLWEKEVVGTVPAMGFALVAAQEWMDESVRNTPVETFAEAAARRLDTSEVDMFIRLNRRGLSADEVKARLAELRFRFAVEKLQRDQVDAAAYRQRTRALRKLEAAQALGATLDEVTSVKLGQRDVDDLLAEVKQRASG